MAPYGSARWKALHNHFNAKPLVSSNGRHRTDPNIRVCSFCPENARFEVFVPQYKYHQAGTEAEYAALSQQERVDSYTAYNAEQDKLVDEVVIPHLITEHGYCICTKCQSLVKKTGLSSHKRSFSCEESNRQRIMCERNMVDVTHSASTFLADLEYKAKWMKKFVDWEDYETRDFIDDACMEARRNFSRTGDLARVYTAYVNGDGWQERLWAPQSVAFFMKALMKRFPQEQYEERLREMWDFLAADDFQRECAVGLLDLALDE